MSRRSLREAVAVAGVLIPFFYLAVQVRSLPARIPIHFDLHGNPNGYGSPATLFLLPGISALLYVGLLAVQKTPRSFNLPVPPDSPARPCYEAMAAELVAWMRLEISWTFAITTWVIVRLARSGHPPVNPMLLAVPPLLVVATIVGFLLAARWRCGAQRP